MEFLIFAPIFFLLVPKSIIGSIIAFIIYFISCSITKKKGKIVINNVVRKEEVFFVVGTMLCLFTIFYKRWINTNTAFEFASKIRIPTIFFVIIVDGLLVCCSVVGMLQIRKLFVFILKYYDRVVTFFARYTFKKLYNTIVIMSTILYCVFLGGNRRLWIDEAFTCILIKHSYGEIWKFTAMDVHPPLYYYITKLLTEPFGYSLIAVMAVSIIPYIFIIAFGGYQLNKLCGKKVAIYFMLQFFFFPFTMSYSIEMRMYSWAAAFVFGNAIYAYRCYVEERKTNWLYFVIFGVCSAYTHYFALVSTGFIYLFLLIAILRKNKRKFSLWAIAMSLTIILYLPWVPELVKQLIFKVNNQYWIPDITIRTIYEYYKSVFGGEVGLLAAIFMSLAYLRIFLQIIYQKKRSDILLADILLGIPLCTILTGIIVSILVRPIFVIRYAIPAMPITVLFLAYAIWKCKNKLVEVYVVVISLVIGIIGYGMIFNSEYRRQEITPLTEKTFEAYSTVDCYWINLATKVSGDSGSIAGTMFYYLNDKPVYAVDDFCNVSVNTSVCDNVRGFSSFDHKKNDKVIYFCNVGMVPFDQLYTLYNDVEYIGEFSVSDRYSNVDAYLLTK